ncbi:MAG TPA: hypothetical protein VK699_05410 [Terriglobales bacterium]|jgi:hypothetical protein|nr:hypothetical protein [Terriglobales bacterium]
MPKKVKVEGKVIAVPDDATPDEIDQAVSSSAASKNGFDTQAARQAGYSDDEILQHLAQSRSFDVDGARKAGYSTQEIIDHLGRMPSSSMSGKTYLDDNGNPKVYLDNSGNRIPAAQKAAPTLSQLQGPAAATPNFYHSLRGDEPMSQRWHQYADVPREVLSHPIDAAKTWLQVMKEPIPDAPDGWKHMIHEAAATVPQVQWGDFIAGPKQAITHPIDSAKLLLHSLADPMAEAQSRGLERLKQPGAGNKVSGAVHYLEGSVPVIGPGLEKASTQYENKDFSGGTGTTLGIAGQVFGPKALGEVSGIRPPMQNAALAREESMYRLTQATNPDKLDVGHVNAQGGGSGFEGNLNDVHDILTDHAGKTGLLNKINKARTPAYQMEAAASTARDAAQTRPYFDRYLNPSEPDSVGTTNIKSYGGESNGYNSATIGQLNKRLTNINAELYPKFQKGGAGSAASQAAVNADRAQVLQGEAAGIRDTINNYLSKKYNVPVNQLENLRGEYGKLMDVADTMQFRANALKQAENTRAMTPYSERAPQSATELGGRIVGGTVNKIVGNPTTNALRKAFSYQGKPAALPEPSPLPPQVPRRPPVWKTGPSGGTPPVPGSSSALPPQVPSGANTAVDAIRPTDAEVSVVHPSGQTGTVPMSDLPEALSSGYKLQNPLVKPSTQSPPISTVRPGDFLNKIGADEGVIKTEADRNLVNSLTNAYKAGKEVEPVEIEFNENGEVTNANGRHRATAAKRAGVDRIPVRITHVPSRQ